MPIITVDLLAGRDQQQKQDFAERVIEAAHDCLRAERHRVIIRFTEHGEHDVIQGAT